jgi:hypothetical protein
MAMSLQTDFSINPPLAYEGQLIGPIELYDIIPAKNADSVSIPFGTFVAWKKSSPTSDFDVVLPAANTDSIAGVVIHLKSYMPAFSIKDLNGATQTAGQLDANGLVPGTMMAILRRGKIAVKSTAAAAVAVDDHLFVGAVTNTTVTLPGKARNSADSTNTIDCSKQGVFLSSGATGTFLELDVNFNNKP